jgi:hypothetical protein
MASSRPVCDRHPNLQMIPWSLKTTTGQSDGYVCPVPGCGRHHQDGWYFDVVETKPSLEDGTPKDQRDAARAAIMKAIHERLRPPFLPDRQK